MVNVLKFSVHRKLSDKMAYTKKFSVHRKLSDKMAYTNSADSDEGLHCLPFL